MELKGNNQSAAAVAISELPRRSELHLARKLWHMSMGLAIICVYQLTGMTELTAVFVLGSMLAFTMLFEVARLKSPAFNSKAVQFWKPLMRKGEVRGFTGVPYYLASAALVFALFPEPIAVMSLIYLACGDPAASFFGILYGHYGPRFKNGKTLVGTMAAVVVCMICTIVYFGTLPISGPTLFALALIGGLAGAAAELIPIPIDDNFSIPIVSAIILAASFALLGV